MILNRILLLPILFLYLPSFVCFFSSTAYIPFSVFVISISTFCIFLIKKKKYILNVFYIYKTTPFKYLIYLYIWIIISGLFACFMGYYSITRFLVMIGLVFIFRIILVYLYPSNIFPKYFSIKKIAKYTCTIYFLLLIIGILEFIGSIYNIDIINNFISFFSNIRSVENSIIIESYSGLPRIRSLFMEPGGFAKFLVVNLPFIYELAMSNSKIYKNLTINFLYKKFIVCITWVCLFLTQSPISIILALIISLIYFHTNIIQFIKKHFLISSIALVLLLLCLFNISYDFSRTFLIRITNVMAILDKFSLESLILQEPSLATRIVCYINQFQLFLKYPFFGLGFGNTGILVIQHFQTSNIPLTQEMQISLIESVKTMKMTSNAMYLLLYQTGFLGFILYCIFMTKNFLILKKIKFAFQGLEYSFVKGVSHAILALFIISIFYAQGFVDEYMFYLCGLIPSIMLSYKNKERFNGNSRYK